MSTSEETKLNSIMRSSLLCLLLLVSFSCGDDDRPSSDSGPVDSGAVDAATDTGPATDTGTTTDSGSDDAGSDDAGSDDAGSDDAGVLDGGAADTGPGDTGIDAGGGVCADNSECDSAGFCAGETCDGPGTCARRPEACPGIYAPVCGCDGRTFGNACLAANSGVRVQSVGECEVAGDCSLTPPFTCCYEDGDCAGLRCTSDRCEEGAAGVCVGAPPPGQCWVDADCPGSTCEGESICPCGAACLLPDSPGCCGGPCS